MWIWGNKIEFCIKSSGFFDKVYMDIRQTNWLYTESEQMPMNITAKIQRSPYCSFNLFLKAYTLCVLFFNLSLIHI